MTLGITEIIGKVYGTVTHYIPFHTVLIYMPEVSLISALVYAVGSLIAIFMSSRGNFIVSVIAIRHYLVAVYFAYILYALFVSPVPTGDLYKVLASLVVVTLFSFDIGMSIIRGVFGVALIVAVVLWSMSFNIGSMLCSDKGLVVGMVFVLVELLITLLIKVV